ncbi:MAG: hypothetical protein HYU58_18550 [Proteobacteria bacterium]|nr:hypothetical protein [Pseudomonadota bacterium]
MIDPETCGERRDLFGEHPSHRHNRFIHKEKIVRIQLPRHQLAGGNAQMSALNI